MTHISKPAETAELMATIASLAHKTLKRKAQGAT